MRVVERGSKRKPVFSENVHCGEKKSIFHLDASYNFSIPIVFSKNLRSQLVRMFEQYIVLPHNCNQSKCVLAHTCTRAHHFHIFARAAGNGFMHKGLIFIPQGAAWKIR